MIAKARIMFLCISLCSFLMVARSVHRPMDPAMPHLITRWVDGTTEYHFWHESIEERSIFQQYDYQYMEEHFLPDSGVPPRDRTALPVPGIKLKTLLEELINEIKSSNKVPASYQHFIILKHRNYDPATHAGLLILKFKDYPFVAKLFIEDPESFLQPFSKGIEPSCFFIMGSGASRFLSGFSRIKNGEVIHVMLEKHPEWRDILDTPCKWFWYPRHVRWFEVQGEHIGCHPQHAVFPSIYAIICQAIDSDATFSLMDKTHRELGIKFSHMFDNRIDPHIDNFMVEKGTGKIVIIDTEHFPTIVGLREPVPFDNYLEWYVQLAKKFLHDGYFRTKQERHDLQKNTHPILTYN